MREEGLPHVYQLEGGILKYFELTDGAHYHGGCFVFDERRVLDLPGLPPTLLQRPQKTLSNHELPALDALALQPILSKHHALIRL